MPQEYAKNEKEAIDQYYDQGYRANYLLKEGKLVDLETQHAYSPSEIFIVAEHRYEGISNPSDMSILYVIETKDGSKGTRLVGYGPAGNLESAEFFKAVPKENYTPTGRP